MARIVDSSNTLTSPTWAGDFLNREHLVPGGARLDAAQFNTNTAVVVQLNGAASAAAVSITVDALPGAIPSGTLLYFGQTGEYARTTSAAAAGATTIAVEALPAALEDNDTATYSGTSQVKTVPSGTLVGRTYTERDAGTGFGPAAAADDEIYLLAFDVTDAAINPDCELYRHGSIVKETYVPGWSALSSDLKTAIRSRYQTTIAASGR